MLPQSISSRAACKGLSKEDYDDFFPSSYHLKDPENIIPLPADHICHRCPVEEECHQYGLHHEVYGTWGGRTEHELFYERKRLKIKKPSTIVVGMVGIKPKKVST